MTKLSIDEIEKQLKKLSTEYCNAVRDEFILMFAQHAIKQFEQNGNDPNNIPYPYGQYIRDKIIELMLEKEFDESKQIV